MKVLVIGSGGREHCLAWKIAQSPLADKIYCAPGNGGTACLSQNINLLPTDIKGLLGFALEKKVDLTVVGPEAPLVEGIVDRFEAKGLKIFGPRKDLASLEGSKVFAKRIMKKYNIPTAGFEVFADPNEAKEYIKKRAVPVVVKSDGLAAGKGVFVCRSQDEAITAIERIISEKEFGKAGEKVVIEDCLGGEEVSILVFLDGKTSLPLVSSQDHKAIYDGDKGPNTGGMGAYAPAPLVNKYLFAKVTNRILNPLIEGLKKDDLEYKGMLYLGLMIKDGSPFVLEFNVRFGDPETQAIIPKLKSDLLELMLKVADGTLGKVKLEWDRRFCLCVVLASGGYPGAYEKRKEIKGLEKVEKLEDIFVFHAGTKLNVEPQSGRRKFLTNGGRVLGISGLAPTIEGAQSKVYSAVENIHFDKIYYRRDIGSKGLKSAFSSLDN